MAITLDDGQITNLLESCLAILTAVKSADPNTPIKDVIVDHGSVRIPLHLDATALLNVLREMDPETN